jgi:hypothetical protein
LQSLNDFKITRGSPPQAYTHRSNEEHLTREQVRPMLTPVVAVAAIVLRSGISPESLNAEPSWVKARTTDVMFLFRKFWFCESGVRARVF